MVTLHFDEHDPKLPHLKEHGPVVEPPHLDEDDPKLPHLDEHGPVAESPHLGGSGFVVEALTLVRVVLWLRPSP